MDLDLKSFCYWVNETELDSKKIGNRAEKSF